MVFHKGHNFQWEGCATVVAAQLGRSQLITIPLRSRILILIRIRMQSAHLPRVEGANPHSNLERRHFGGCCCCFSSLFLFLFLLLLLLLCYALWAASSAMRDDVCLYVCVQNVSQLGGKGGTVRAFEQQMQIST